MTTLFNKLKDGLNSIYKDSSPQKLGRSEDPVVITEQFRDALLGMVQEIGTDESFRLARRIRHAHDLQTLWFMRSEVMAVLAPIHGEAEAMHRLDQVSAAVRESLPTGLRSRPSPLSNH